MSARLFFNCDWCDAPLANWLIVPGSSTEFNTSGEFPLKGHFCRNCIELAYSDPLIRAAFQRLPELAEARAKAQKGRA